MPRCCSTLRVGLDASCHGVGVQELLFLMLDTVGCCSTFRVSLDASCRDVEIQEFVLVLVVVVHLGLVLI